MNERIRELMGKTLDDKFSHTWNTMSYEGLLQFSEKFAELIVQECAAFLRDTMGDDFAAEQMKEHFGVDE